MSLPTVSISIISILTKLNHQVFRVSDLSRLPHINVEGRAVEEKEQRLSISCEFDILGLNRFFPPSKWFFDVKVSGFFIFLIIPQLGHCVAGRSSVALFSLKKYQVPLNFLISFSGETPLVQIHHLYKKVSRDCRRVEVGPEATTDTLLLRSATYFGFYQFLWS